MRRNFERAKAFVEYIQEKYGNFEPEIAIVLGTGLSNLANEIDTSIIVEYSKLYGNLPGFPEVNVSGHDGRLIFGTLEGKKVVCQSGRFHFYDVVNMEDVTLMIRMFQAMKVKNLFITNAAGGLSPDYQKGDLVLIKDHISLFCPKPPLVGKYISKHDDEIGPEFQNMVGAYPETLRIMAKNAAKNVGVDLNEGVYAMTSGRQFETPAEIHLLSMAGVGLVGMSTVPEVITAVHAGMNVLGISLVTNMAAGITGEPLSHDETKESGKEFGNKFIEVAKAILRNWDV